MPVILPMAPQRPQADPRPPVDPPLRRALRAPASDDPIIRRLAGEIARACAQLAGEPVPVFDLLPRHERADYVRWAVRAVRALDPEVEAAAIQRAARAITEFGAIPVHDHSAETERARTILARYFLQLEIGRGW